MAQPRLTRAAPSFAVADVFETAEYYRDTLGFRFEGVFRQHMVVKGRSRDTAYFSMLDSEWPARKLNFEHWLDRENFDGEGRQKLSLAALNGQKA